MFLFTEIEVDFSQESYTFREGEMDNIVCVQLVRGSVEISVPRNVEVDLMTTDITTSSM